MNSLNLRILSCMLLFLGSLSLMRAQSSSEPGNTWHLFQSETSAKQRFQLFFESSQRYKDHPALEWQSEIGAMEEKSLSEGDTLSGTFYAVMLSQLKYDLGAYQESAGESEALLQGTSGSDSLVRAKLLEIADKSYEKLALYNKQLQMRIAAKEMGIDVDLHDIYANLGLNRHALMDYTVQNRALEQSSSPLDRATYFYNRGYYLRRDGAWYTAQKELESAYTAMETYLMQNAPADTEDKRFRALYLQGKIMGNLGKCYLGQKKYPKAIPYLETGLLSTKEYEKGAYSPVSMEYWADLADAYLSTGMLNLAGKYLDSLEQFAGSHNTLKTRYAELMSDFYLKNNDLENAASAFREYTRLKDSLDYSDLRKQMLGLLVTFDLDNQKEDIIQQQKADIARNIDEIEQREKTIFLSVVALIFCFACVITLVIAYLKSLKNKRLIEKQKMIIERSLTEKESLLKEIHHRVKNNLQMVSSLLSLQSRNTKSKAAIEALEEGMSRVKAMALIHQKLYQNENLSVICMQEYIESLVASIQSVYRKEGYDIQVNINSGKTELDVDRAIPIGLILNELVSNSFKYAFPETRKGIIDISLKSMEETPGEYTFEYRDNGVGLPDETETVARGAMGLNLIKRLANQLRSKLQVDNQGPGVKFWFTFS